jgi:hypothetical protein
MKVMGGLVGQKLYPISVRFTPAITAYCNYLYLMVKPQLSVLKRAGSTIQTGAMQELLDTWPSRRGVTLKPFWRQNQKHEGEELRFLGALQGSFFEDLNLVFLVYSVDSPASLLSLYQYWYPLLQNSVPHASLFLIGTKRDLRPQEVEKVADLVVSYPPEDGSSPFLSTFLVLQDCICSYMPPETLVSLGETSQALRQYYVENFQALYFRSLKEVKFVSPFQGRYMAKIMSGLGWGECTTTIHPGWKGSGPGTAEEEDYKKKIAANQQAGIRAWGATTSPVPEVDRVWVQALRLHYDKSIRPGSKTPNLTITKFD